MSEVEEMLVIMQQQKDQREREDREQELQALWNEFRSRLHLVDSVGPLYRSMGILHASERRYSLDEREAIAAHMREAFVQLHPQYMASMPLRFVIPKKAALEAIEPLQLRVPPLVDFLTQMRQLLDERKAGRFR